jgi:ligand-binding sensor domain-containing protein
MSNDNTLWIGGGYFLRAFNLDSKTLGPDKYLRIAECFINYFPGDGYHFIRSGPQGNLWISSFTCLFKYYPKTGDHLLINPYSGKKPTVINGLEWDSLGYAWGGGYRGIVRINPNTGEYFSLKMDLIFTEEDDHSIFSVDKSSKGQILFQNYRNLFSLEIIKDNVWDDLYIERYMIREVIP